ncbi:MAG: hypothetical protein KIT72_07335 [Polyangiaceae bacterium]|nr:hypothetical protein [Polyangiaceae bacterium]MCW5790216.1 hypothetical protein [Polyangiaceae bacterium]
MAAQPNTQQSRVGRALVWLSFSALTCALGWKLGATLLQVVRRLRFPYDLMYWPDDYYLSMVLRLELGLGAYGPPSDANSWIYSPGGPALGWALLSPLGLERSYLAHKWLAQLWFWLAVLAGCWVGRQVLLGERAARGDARRVSPFELGVLAAVLALAALMSPIADSLHPTNLELTCLCLASVACAALPRLTPAKRLIVCFTLPAVSLWFKQTGAVAVTASLMTSCLFAPSLHRGERLRLILATGLGAGCLLGALRLLHGPHFIAWVWEIPSAAGFQGFKTRDLSSGLGILVYPMLLLVLLRLFWRPKPPAAKPLPPDKARSGDEREAEHDRPRPPSRTISNAGALAGAEQANAPALYFPPGNYIRLCLPTLCYTPLALVALFKTLGGPNNLTALLFLYTALGAPLLIDGLSRGEAWRRAAHAAALTLCTFALWSPKKRLPTAADYRYGAQLCELVAARQACGERVYLGRGMVCFMEGSELPKDRVMAAEDVSQSRHALGYGERLRAEHYDVVIGVSHDLLSPWLKEAQWPVLKERYVPFGRLDAGPSGDVWTEGFSNHMGPTVLFERLSQKGSHDPAQPHRCHAQP